MSALRGDIIAPLALSYLLRIQGCPVSSASAEGCTETFCLPAGDFEKWCLASMPSDVSSAADRVLSLQVVTVFDHLTATAFFKALPEALSNGTQANRTVNAGGEDTDMPDADVDTTHVVAAGSEAAVAACTEAIVNLSAVLQQLNLREYPDLVRDAVDACTEICRATSSSGAWLNSITHAASRSSQRLLKDHCRWAQCLLLMLEQTPTTVIKPTMPFDLHKGRLLVEHKSLGPCLS